MHRTLRLWTVLLLGAASAASLAQTFRVGKEAGLPVSQTVTVESDADFENFTGITHGVSGVIRIDAAKKTGSGRLEIDLASIDTGVPLRNEHMRSPQWLDTAKYPTAVFEATSVRHKSGDTFTVTGKLTFHGVTRTISTDVEARLIRESAQSRAARFKGDVVRVKGQFRLRLSDYGVKIPDMAKGKVAEVVTIRFDVFGQTG
ncbi:MAG TPA: YceI family protein [Armatimonadetes bacterium]|nr:YceI family protein [Armatimonadota bacterium]